jgi:hypothetical protein
VVAEMRQRVDDFLLAGVVGGPATGLATRGLPDQAAALELIEDEPAGRLAHSWPFTQTLIGYGK